MQSFSINDVEFKSELKRIGAHLFAGYQSEVQQSLRSFITVDQRIDGTALQASWFPQVDAEIFISHAHADYEMAILLSGWIYKTFELRCFIDSLVWRYANDLLREIDNNYCWNTDRRTYNYDKRNLSTSHVHMMLCSAISSMMDRAECLLFLNSVRSVSTYKGVDQTHSPWIYFEVGLSQHLEKKIPSRIRNKTRFLSESEVLEKSLGNVTYALDLQHLAVVPVEILARWLNTKSTGAVHGLDRLYELVPGSRKSSQIPFE
jgi:hypothetical protein